MLIVLLTGSVELRTEIEEELVHGVTLFASLSGWGKHWSKQSASSMCLSGFSTFESVCSPTSQWLKVFFGQPRYQAGQAYNLSFVTSQFRSFISHDWKTSGWLKFLALLWVFNSPAAFLGFVAMRVSFSGSRLRTPRLLQPLNPDI